MPREVKQLRNKQVPLVKVLWHHHGREEGTWESKATMRAQYPQLYESGMNFEDEILLKGGRVVTPQIIPLTVLYHVLGIIKVNEYFFWNKNMRKK